MPAKQVEMLSMVEHSAAFVDLFVKATKHRATAYYKSIGYTHAAVL